MTSVLSCTADFREWAALSGTIKDMETFWIRSLSQAGIYATFALYFAWAMRRGAKEWVPLVGGAVYAVVFEHLNMLRYAHVTGGYHYHAASWLFLWNDVPLYIPLAWGFIIRTSMRLTDSLQIQEAAKPFCDALLALLVDLSLDVVAIRLHFWYWHGVQLNEGFFGVPADNFLGWLLVTFTFSFLTRRLWRQSPLDKNALLLRIIVQWAAIPILAYAAYLGLEAVVHGAYFLAHARTQREQLYVLAGVVVVFLAAIGRRGTDFAPTGKRFPHDEWTLHVPRHIFHIFGLIGLLCLPLTLRSPSLFLVTACVWLLDMAIGWRIRRLRVRSEGE